MLPEPIAQRAAGWMLIVGTSLALIGAAWPPYKQWYSPLEEALRVIASHPIGWRCIHTGFATGTIITALGLAVFANARAGQPGGVYATVAAVAYAMATVFWLVNIAYRLSVMPWAANEFVSSGAIPAMYAPLERMGALMFTAFSAMAAVASVSSAGAVSQSGIAPRWVAWTSLVVGVIAAPMVAMIGPWVLYVPFLTLGIALVRR